MAADENVDKDVHLIVEEKADEVLPEIPSAQIEDEVADAKNEKPTTWSSS